MLRLITGKAGSGKTAAVIREIASAVAEKRGGIYMIVPEQYSHEAERELCRACGDSLSLYAEVFSFTALARRVAAQQGGAAAAYLDKGGRLLCMALALNNIGSRLRVYSAAARKPELQDMLLKALDEMKSACIDTERLFEAAESCTDSLGDKLHDLALISEAYEAVLSNGHADPSDRLELLARQIEEGDYSDSRFYVDGFIDFTRQEQRVLEALLKKGAELTLCLTMDSAEGDNEIYELSRISAARLINFCKENNIAAKTESYGEGGGKDASLRYFADNMFSYSRDKFGGETCAVELFCAESVNTECEFAAAKSIELVREKGCRWRDIAVAVRGFEDYRGPLESVFAHYDVPLFVARRSELLAKPLPSLISGMFEIVESGWDVDAVISYLRTGLSGLSHEDCDILCDYIFRWQLRAGAWERRDDWKQHPDGYNNDYTDETWQRLREINLLRRRVAMPIINYRERSKVATTAREQAAALAEYMEELELPRLLAERAEKLCAASKESLAQEYQQLWDIMASSLEQFAAILGEMPMDAAGFGKLYTLMLSKYDIGTIPVSLDRVSAGDFDRMRRRSIKHLIVLGCSDRRLPMAEDEAGMFSGEERQRLIEMEIELGGGEEGELWREFSLIYNCLSLPSESLILSYPLCGSDGDEERSAFVYNRAAAIFGISSRKAELEKLRMAAPAPALSLAAQAVKGGSGAALAAAKYFGEHEPERYAALKSAAEMSRGRLSPKAVESLYGKKLRLSASKIDKFSACKFAYFCQYGLKAKPYEPAGFKPPEIGTFMHYVLEHTAKAVKALGGFGQVSDKKLRQITQEHIDRYVAEELNDFEEKSSRFIHLFKRICHDVHQVVSDMAAELRRSDFEPLDFELNFSDAREIPPVELGEGEDVIALSGVADRVDGWLHEGKLYLRVVDYKTGKKKFSMSDVWHGMGLQMLLYLFALEESGEKRYGHEIVPAGIMYVPARNAMLSLSRDVPDAEVQAELNKEVQRSGLVLDDEALKNAWEHGEEKLYIPIKFRYGKPTADSLASLERMALLSAHIKKDLTAMAAELRKGSISADPYYRSQQENACLFCDYFDACHFKDGENGEKVRFLSKISAEKVWQLMEEGGEQQ